MKSDTSKMKEMRENYQEMVEAVGGVYSTSSFYINELLDGDFSFQQYFGGLSTHISYATELQNVHNIFELPECLSFNIVFEGQINISLANETYQLGSMADSVECSAIVAAQPEVLTRRLTKGMKVSKLNVFVKRSWLQARCKSLEDVRYINRFFEYGTTFLSWKASDEIIKQAGQLIEKSKHESVFDKIHTEQLTIELLLTCLIELEQHLDLSPKKSLATQKKYTNAPKNLKQKIDGLMMDHYTLKDIAKIINLSVSTLQRSFKSQYGTTVSDYCQQRRLEIAKKSMLVDNLSIGEASYLAGYKHPSNFISAFKKRFLITPAALIAKHKLATHH